MEKIADFLGSKVMGKVLVTDELKYSLEDGRLEGAYSDKIIFSNLVRTGFGINFDMFLNSNKVIYLLDENRRRIGIRSDLGGISVFRYELAVRKSTEKVTGIFRLITTTAKDQTAQAIASGASDVELDCNGLHWKEEQLLYRDQISENNKYLPVAFSSKNRLFFENGKIRYEYDGICFDIEPAGLRKKHRKTFSPGSYQGKNNRAHPKTCLRWSLSIL